MDYRGKTNPAEVSLKCIDTRREDAAMFWDEGGFVLLFNLGFYQSNCTWSWVEYLSALPGYICLLVLNSSEGDIFLFKMLQKKPDWMTNSPQKKRQGQREGEEGCLGSVWSVQSWTQRKGRRRTANGLLCTLSPDRVHQPNRNLWKNATEAESGRDTLLPLFGSPDSAGKHTDLEGRR